MKLFTSILVFIILGFNTSHAANRYWVSNVAGVWNNSANWSTTSGGAGGASIPSTSDRVYLSNTSGSGNITLDVDVAINGFVTTGYTGTLDFDGHQFNPSNTNTAYILIDHITIINSTGNVNLTYNTVATTRIYSATINVPIVVTSQRLQLINATFNQNVTINQTSNIPISSFGGCTFNGDFTFNHYGNQDYKLGTSTKMIYNGDAYFVNYGTHKILISSSGQGSDFNGNIYIANTGSTNYSGVFLGSVNSPVTLASSKTINIGNQGFAKGLFVIRRFTQNGNVPQNLTLTGTARLDLGIINWNGQVTFSAPQIYVRSNQFHNTTTLTQTGSSTTQSSGNNHFWANSTIQNTGTGTFTLGYSYPDIFDTDLTLKQLSSGTLSFASKSANNTVLGNLYITHIGTGTSSLIIANDSTSSLSVTGITTILDQSTGTDNQTILGNDGDVYFLGNVNISNQSNSTSSKIIIGKDERAEIITDGITTVTNEGTGALAQIIIGEKGDLTFNNTLNLINNATATDSKIILDNQTQSSNQYHDITFTCTNAASEGFFFGLNYGRGVVKNTYTLSASNTGVTNGLLHFRNFVQEGATAQNLTLTQNASLLLDRSYWYGAINFISPSISIKQNRFFNASAILEQTGSNNTFSFGYNVAYKYLTIKNSGSGSFILGQTARDIFTKGLRLWNVGAGKIYLGYSSLGNSISETLDIDNQGTTTNSNIYVGYSSSSQVSVSRANINNSKGNTYFGYGGDITMAVIEINNNTSTDATTYVAYEQTSFVRISSPSFINNSGTGTSSNIICGHEGDVVFNGTLNINNSAAASTSEIIFGNSSSSSINHNNDILITSTGAYDSKIIFGKNNAVNTLATNKTVTTPSFTSGRLRFDHFTQLGTLSQVLNMSLGYLELDNSTWNGTVNFKAKSITLKENTFKLYTTLETTSNSYCYGGNTFFGPVTIKSTGYGQFSFGNTAADLFKSNLTLNVSRGTVIIAAGSTGNLVLGNITATTTNYSSNIRFASSANSSLTVNGYVYLLNNAHYSTSWNNPYYSTITLGAQGDVTLNSSLSVINSGGNSKNLITVAQSSTSKVSITGNTSVSNSGGYSTKKIYLGYQGEVIFNGLLSITNASYASESGVYLNHEVTSSNSYNQNIILKSTNSYCDGIFFGANGGSGTLANTKTVTIPSPSTTNFIGGTLLFKNFTQLGATPQNLTLAGTASFFKTESSTWGGNVNFKAPQIELKQSTFSGNSSIEKTGANDNLCYGGNNFVNTAIKNSGSGALALGSTSPDTFSDLVLTNNGASDLILGDNSTLNMVGGNLSAINNSSASSSRIIIAKSSTSRVLVVGNSSFQNQSAGATKNIYIGYNGYVECDGTCSISNFSTATNSTIHVAHNSNGSFRSVGNVTLASHYSSSDGITFGQNGGSTTLDAGINTTGNFYGLLYLNHVYHLGLNPITISQFNNTSNCIVIRSSQFKASQVTFTAPNITSYLVTYENNVTFNKTSNGQNVSTSDGYNNFKGVTKYYNYASGDYILANSYGNDYNNDVYFYKYGTGQILPARNQTSTFSDNIMVYSTVPFNFGLESLGGAKLDGTMAQSITNTSTTHSSINFKKLITQNATNDISLNSGITISGNLELNEGNLIPTATGSITMLDNATVTAVSNNAYVDGEVIKLGNDAFTFPVGNNGIYAPISISAPANTTDKFTASYHNSPPTTAGFNTSLGSNGVDYMSNTEYWTLDRTAGTNDVEVTLSWDDTRSGQIGAGTICESRVVQWDGSKWTNQGNGNATGNSTSGTVTTGISRDCATTTPLTNWANGYPLALASDSNYITWDGTVFEGGSGTSGAPGEADNSRNLKIFGANATLAENAHVKNVVITGTGNITIPDGMVATVDGDIRNNGQITVENGGSLIQTKLGASNNSGTGNYTVKVTGNNSPSTYNIWSSPVQSAAITSVFTAANPCDIYAFDAPTQSWKYDYVANSTITCVGNTFAIDPSYVFSGADGNMDIARGYFAPGNAINTRNFNGKINNGDINYAVNTTTLGNNANWDNDDWNLLGNPYPSSIAAAAFWAQNSSLITGALYFWDEGVAASGYHQYTDYAYWNLAGGLNSGNSSRIPNGNIAPGQGFWFYASNSGNAIFRNNMRTENAGIFFKSNPTQNHNAWFSFKTPSGLENNILVGYNTDATDGYDAKYDANKTVGNTSVRMASILNNDEYAIQSFAPLMIGSEKVIPLVVFTDSTGSHTFEMYRTENIPSNFKIYLKDLLLDLTTDLTQTEYTVSLNGNQEYLNRFELVFVNDITHSGGGSGTKGGNGGSDSTVTGVTDLTHSNFVLIQTESELIVSNKNGFSGTIQIFDVTGKLLWKSTKIENSVSKNIDWSSWSKGSYFVTITHDQENVFSKQIIKIN